MSDPSGAEPRTVDEGRERRLIEGLQRNDRGSIEEIYDAYAGIAYALAVRLLGARDAEDVVQESFLALWRQAERLDPRRGVRSYLLTIVHHRAIDYLRRRGRKPEAVLEESAPLVDQSEGPEGAAVRLSDRDAVRAALGSLPEEQLQSIEMTFFQGLTINEAAARMGVPTGTVKSRLRLAMGRLRGRLSGQ